MLAGVRMKMRMRLGQMSCMQGGGATQPDLTLRQRHYLRYCRRDTLFTATCAFVNIFARSHMNRNMPNLSWAWGRATKGDLNQGQQPPPSWLVFDPPATFDSPPSRRAARPTCQPLHLPRTYVAFSSVYLCSIQQVPWPGKQINLS
jgi:hypothetical protein